MIRNLVNEMNRAVVLNKRYIKKQEVEG